MTKPDANLCYPVLTPFKYGGFVVKPPSFIQMGEDEAREYQDAGVLGGGDGALLPLELETHDEPQATATHVTETHSAATQTQPPAAKPPAKAKKAPRKKATK
ncbi:MAG: hypothetical protein L0H70_08590 [Xanthomonadales bacterium]|nr:hypothetical protein [Xanthomonadales bacterium]